MKNVRRDIKAIKNSIITLLARRTIRPPALPPEHAGYVVFGTENPFAKIFPLDPRKVRDNFKIQILSEETKCTFIYLVMFICIFGWIFSVGYKSKGLIRLPRLGGHLIVLN